MNELELAALAGQINKKHTQYEVALKAGVQQAINVGLLLLQAKALCQRAGWSKWLGDNVSFSESIARGYTNAARQLATLEEGKAQPVADLSLRQTLALVAELVAPELTPAELGAIEYQGQVDLLTDLTGKPINQVQELIGKLQEVESLLEDKFYSWLYLQHNRTRRDYQELKGVAFSNLAEDSRVLNILWKWYGGREGEAYGTG